MGDRSRSWNVAMVAALATCLASDAWSAVTRLPLRGVGVAPDAPIASLEIGAETRPVFAPSGRRVLAVQPAEVGDAGRLFAFGAVPPEAASEDFTAEVLVWEFPRPASEGVAARTGGWRRVALPQFKVATGNTVSATVVDPELAAGPIITGVFARAAVAADGRVATSEPVEVPRGARLRFAYGIDELDTRSLAPVTLSVTGLIEKRAGEIERVEIFRRELAPSSGLPGWTELTADLGKLSGDRVAFEFRSVSRPGEGQLATHVAWATPTILHQTRGKPATTVILVSLGNVRAQSLSCCGATRATTPFLDGLFGSEGVIFQRAITEAVDPVTAHMSLLTGASPCRHGVRSGRKSLDKSVRTLAERFAAAGYATGGFSDGGGLVSELGFSRGFDVYLERTTAPFDRALAWLESRGGEPGFLFLHARQANTDLDAYETRIRQLDDELRGFLLKLDQLVDPDRVLIAITSGHGEEFLEHGALGHGTHLFEESVRVPLLLRGGGVKAGTKPAALMGAIDVAPTLLQLAGQPTPTDFEGFARGNELRTGTAWSSEMRFVEANGGERRLATGVDASWRPPGYAGIEGPLKMIRDGDSSVYSGFNIAQDTGERHDLLADMPAPDWAARLREAVAAHAAACEGSREAPPAPIVLNPESRLELIGLGYPD
jgi:arylsulfatase A-like enzyme